MNIQKDSICEQSCLKIHTVAKYLEHYLSGRDCSELSSFTGVASKGALTSPARYLQLMGTLSALTDAE